MQLSTYIQRTRALGGMDVPKATLDTIGGLIEEQGTTFDELLEKRSEKLKPLMLLGIWRASRRHQIHQAYLKEVAGRRRAESETQIPWALLQQTTARHEVAILERAEALAPSGRTAEHRRRDAIKTTVSLWNACLALVRKQAVLKVEKASSAPKLIDEFGDYLGRSALNDVSSHRWLGIRRGERLGALSLRFELPMEKMVDQVKARESNLLAISVSRDPRTLLEALVLPDLVEWAVELKDVEAQLLATRTACNSYLSMLTTPRTKHPLLAAVSVPARGPLGLAVVMRDGRLVASDTVTMGDDPVADLERVIGGHPVAVIVLPAESRRTKLLDTISEGFSALEVERATTKGMKGALRLSKASASTAIKRAHVLAQRVAQPLDHWLAIDPISLELADYQQELDEDELRAALEDMKALARAGVSPSDLQRSRGAGVTSGRPTARAPSKPLNPLVKSVDDLRPGMEINGVVTNITQFGAFLNIGLTHEGLVHVSELADHFVNDPNEVVSVGQHVKAQVLGVDRARRRISLSLRPPAAARMPGGGRLPQNREAGLGGSVPLDDIPGRGRGRRGGGGGGGGFGDRQRPGGNVSRAQALADLEALFKKK